VTSINAWDPITEEAVLQALDLILTPSNYPMMIMCNLGRHRTGKLQRVNVFICAYCQLYRHHSRLFEKTTEMELDVDI
jgi:hypothetical protein